ncbi:HIPL1 protein-like [Phragmites australis]|uniref:HIPL1 protein-like n=1 Tax=Phragmites australis TaxID=29695 RepID=UPI002D77ED71|nr:HIPL1 protein-like [Phragmites australis]
MQMGMRLGAAILLSFSLLLLPASRAFPLCTDARAPVVLNETLGFCASYNGSSSSCCDAAADAALRSQFNAMNVSDAACAAVLKSILCAKCSPYSADLFDAGPKIRTIPFLCNSTSSATSAQSKETTQDYCKLVWETCKDVKIMNSPFQPPLQGSATLPSTSSKLTDAWQSENDFCTLFGGAPNDQSVCFSGNVVSFNTTQPSPSPKGICLERIDNGSYLNMAPHPDGSNRIFLGSQAGKIWLATVPEQGSGGTLQFEEASPFVDLTDQVHFDSVFGLMGLAFHPKFATNGRFFASYNCDRTKSPSCTGRCSCNSDVSCDPSKLGTDNGAQPCQYQVVVSEYSAKGSSANVSEVTSADPSEVRRIFTMGLPYGSQHGGQVLFGPTDGYLYLMMGDGGKGDPFNFAQNKKSLLGKIVRLDIDNTPRESDITNKSFWGNYSIPKDNPYADDSDLEPEIWALGLRNPWRCSFDSERPSYFFCGDTGQDQYEEVDLISKGGNYGWRAYEGPLVYHPSWAPGGNTSLNYINTIPPIMGYSHADVNKNIGSASIMGGYVYRGSTDPCLSGRYLYADLYASAMWTGTETPESSGNYTSTLIPFSCSKDSPIPCDTAAGSPLPSLGYIYSFGEDNSKDIYVLASKGVYRVVRPSLCDYTCPTEKAATNRPPGPSSKAPAIGMSKQMRVLLLSVIMFWVLVR